MNNSVLSRYLGLQEQSNQVNTIFSKFLIIVSLENLVTGIASSFFILYVINEIGFEGAAVITAILLFVKLLADYPTGSLGDYLGQGKVLALSYLFYALAMGILVFATAYYHYIMIAVFIGLAEAQESGALTSWLDNQYTQTAQNNDPEMRNYAFAMTRARTLYRAELGFIVLLGGYLSYSYSRLFVFKLVTGLAILTIFLVLLLLRENDSKTGSNDASKMNYFWYLKGGFRFAVSTRKNFLFFFGSSFFNASQIIWVSLLLFPFYFGYTGNDNLAGILRSTIFFLGTILLYLFSNVSKKFGIKSLGNAIFIYSVFFYGGILSLLYLVPQKEILNGFGVAMVLIIFSITIVISIATNSLTLRVHLEIIPSEQRNSLYSLLPSLSSFFSILLLPLTGLIIRQIGLPGGITLIFITGLLSSYLVHLSLNLDKN